MTDISLIFDITMGLMDELSNTGAARTDDTKEYEHRTPAIMNILIEDYQTLTGSEKRWTPVESFSDGVNVDTGYAVGVMPYGLAANLLVDENPTAANFYQQRYEEMRAQFARRRPAESSQIYDFYGGIEYGQFGRW